MSYPEKNQIWVFGDEVEGKQVSDGVVRKILAYGEDLMCVENHFETGSVGAIHSHPHTQITYVVSGKFEFTVGDRTQVVKAGDTLYKRDGIAHGCKCLEAGVLLDIFTPMRGDFV